MFTRCELVKKFWVGNFFFFKAAILPKKKPENFVRKMTQWPRELLSMSVCELVKNYWVGHNSPYPPQLNTLQTIPASGWCITGMSRDICESEVLLTVTVCHEGSTCGGWDCVIGWIVRFYICQGGSAFVICAPTAGGRPSPVEEVYSRQGTLPLYTVIYRQQIV